MYAILPVLLLSVFLRFDNINMGLPQRLAADEATQVENAVQMLGGDLNPHFFRYSTAQIYLLAALYASTGLTASPLDGHSRYLIARMLVAVMGVITVVLLFLATYRLFGMSAALIAGLLLAVNATHVELSHYATVDVPMLMWITAMVFFFASVVSDGHLNNTVGMEKSVWYRIIMAGASIGMAIATKYSGAFFLPLYVLGLMWVFFSTQQRIVPEAYRRKAAIIAIICAVALLSVSVFIMLIRENIIGAAAVYTTDGVVEKEYGYFIDRMTVLLLIGSLFIGMLAVIFLRCEHTNPFHFFHDKRMLFMLLVPVVVFVIASPYVLIDWQHSLRDILYEYRHMSIGSAAHYFVGSKEYDEVLSAVTATSSATFYFRYVTDVFGYAFLISFFAGVLVAVRDRQWFVIAFACMTLFYAGVILSWNNVAVRYALPLHPFMVIVVAYFYCIVLQYIVNYRVIAGTIVLVVILFIPSIQAVKVLRENRLSDTRMLALEWVHDNARYGGIACDDKTLDLEYYPFIEHVKYSSASIIMDMTIDEITECAYRYVILRDLADVIAPDPLKRELFESRYREIQRFVPEKGITKGPALYLYECLQ